jgi:hypothetical protein
MPPLLSLRRRASGAIGPSGAAGRLQATQAADRRDHGAESNDGATQHKVDTCRDASDVVWENLMLDLKEYI